MNTKYSGEYHSSIKTLCDEFYAAHHVTLERFDSNKMQNRQVAIDQFRIELLKTHDRYMTHAYEAHDMYMTNMNNKVAIYPRDIQSWQSLIKKWESFILIMNQ